MGRDLFSDEIACSAKCCCSNSSRCRMYITEQPAATLHDQLRCVSAALGSISGHVHAFGFELELILENKSR